MHIGVSLTSSHSTSDVRAAARWMIERTAAARESGLDSLFVIAGIHAEEIGSDSAGPDFFARHHAHPVAIMPRLAW